MELLNATRMAAGYTMGLDPEGHESIVIVIKGSFNLPSDGSEAALALVQQPLVMADIFMGNPGYSALLHESDFAPHKPQCDVLVNGSAYAPSGRPAERVTVTLRVGAMEKSFDVVGDRSWDRVLGSTRASDPAPFAVMPIHYGRAYGGVDSLPDKPDDARSYAENPVGVGYYPLSCRGDTIGKPLPNTEEPNRAVGSPDGNYTPMSFGTIGRNFKSRVALAGTYDEHWLENVFPFLPSDFSPLYHQSAPPDQRIAYPKGGEEVALINLTRVGFTSFRLPVQDVPVEFTNASFERREVSAVMDTIIIEPDHGRLLVNWRASQPLRRNMLEIRQVVVGRMTRAWYRARALGKTYHPSLEAHVSSRQVEEEVET
jgi:hypothetical protein